jgi:K+-transporting ATPase ATPase A chain
MSPYSLLQIGIYFALLLSAAKPLGSYMARVFEGERVWPARALGWLERLIYRAGGIRPDEGMAWPTYAKAVLSFSVAAALSLYVLERLQGLLPLNPQKFGGVAPDLAFNTAMSFTTNTNWQFYSGENAMSRLTQMLGLGVHNFASAATGMAVLVALIRGIRQRTLATLGNFWVDLTRAILYILLPLSLILATALVSQGVVQTFHADAPATLAQPTRDGDGKPVAEQLIALGPVASQIAIKQLGTNGGGFYNANSAHPLENPTPLSNLLEMLAILLIPAALCLTYGQMIGDRRQGWALLAAMSILLLMTVPLVVGSEQAGNPRLTALGADQRASDLAPGGNMEGKEVRFGIANSALWAAVTTAASNGSVNSMHDSFTPLGGIVPMWMMKIGEVSFGGVGSGLYGMLMFVIIAVFIAGLMVGRTPEYMGKKIEAYEMKMASLVILIPPLLILTGTALAVSLHAGTSATSNPGPHAFSEILYAFTSCANNNGSAFAGLNGNMFYNLALAAVMLFGRFFLIVPALAVAGSLARKNIVPVSAGTLPTHTPLFVALLIGVVLLVGALTFFPALALGPIVEHLLMIGA